ncbi:MAG: flavin reductase [Candidatus Sericytochromatia bacterium]|nr:MAG: flavin reductase [Candidatus Sericytochromatia bacterium]
MERKESIGKALGKVVSGLYIVTSQKENIKTGFTASFLIQTSFEPPIIIVAIKKGRKFYDFISDTKIFTVNIMPKSEMKLIGKFANPNVTEEELFNNVDYKEINNMPVINSSVSYLSCKVINNVESGDHIIVMGEVFDGELLNDIEPAYHVRKNGF